MNERRARYSKNSYKNKCLPCALRSAFSLNPLPYDLSPDRQWPTFTGFMGLKRYLIAIFIQLFAGTAAAYSSSCPSSLSDLQRFERLDRGASDAIKDLVGVWKNPDTLKSRKISAPVFRFGIRVGQSVSLREKQRAFEWQRRILEQLLWNPDYWARRQFKKNLFGFLVMGWNSRRPVDDMPALATYSLLPSFFDWPLDRGEISEASLGRIREKLSGGWPMAKDDFESDLFYMLDLIREKFPHDKHPTLKWLFLNLFETEVDSVRIQRSLESSQEDLLKASLRKGGIALALNIYILQGRLSDAEFVFAMKEGGLMQLLDDLGDVEQDRSEGTRTIFTEDFDPNNSLDKLKGLIAIQSSILERHGADTRDLADISSIGALCCLGRMGRLPNVHTKDMIGEMSKGLSPIARIIFKTSVALHAWAFRRRAH